MRIAATWKPRWTRVTSARMVMRRDRVLQLRCLSWSITKSMNMNYDDEACASSWTWKPCLVETLAICSSKKKLFINHFESPTRPPACDPSSTLATRLRAFVVPGTVIKLFPAKLSVTESLAFGTLWMFLFSIQASGAGRSTFFFQRCCEGKGKAAYGRHGSGALRIDFQKCMTKLSCMTIAELTNCRESLHVDSRRCSLWSLWTVSRECHEILQNYPLYRGQKIDDYVQHSLRVTTECVHACVHRRLDKKKKESDVTFYLFSKHLESGNVDNCIIWS